MTGDRLGLTLVFNDFGVKCIAKTDVDHFFTILNKDYDLDTD